ncbi:MAG: carboxymuconolactone decarboxylase family protein [Desulfobacterales bacterium]
MENQVQLNTERIELLGKFREAVPQFMAAEAELLEIVYKNGALSSKVKRLIAMAVALKVGCTNCILSQTENALNEGATKDEILETLQVLVAMGGTTGIAESLRVIKFLDELGHL